MLSQKQIDQLVADAMNLEEKLDNAITRLRALLPVAKRLESATDAAIVDSLERALKLLDDACDGTAEAGGDLEEIEEQ